MIMVREGGRDVDCRARAEEGSVASCDLCEEGGAAGRVGVVFDAAISIHALREEGDKNEKCAPRLEC